jgi:hypothetical protein
MWSVNGLVVLKGFLQTVQPSTTIRLPPPGDRGRFIDKRSEVVSADFGLFLAGWRTYCLSQTAV